MGAMLIIGMGGKPKKGSEHMNPMEKFLGKGEDKEPLMEDESAEQPGGSGKIAFSVPAGFRLPDGVKDGESFDAMATLKMEGGRLVLSELDGSPVADEPEGGEDEESDLPEDEGEPKEASPLSEKPSDEEDGGGSEGDLGFLDAVEKKANKRK